jgi:beta-N-acetylhexosaminidase
VDAQPAGYSRVWIEQVLRGELGFAGVVVSDDISMAAAGVAGSVAGRVQAHLAAGCDLVLACFPEVVEEAIAAVTAPPPAARERLSPLRGAVGASWAGLLDNPQRDRFVARITALDAEDPA